MLHRWSGARTIALAITLVAIPRVWCESFKLCLSLLLLSQEMNNSFCDSIGNDRFVLLRNLRSIRPQISPLHIKASDQTEIRLNAFTLPNPPKFSVFPLHCREMKTCCRIPQNNLPHLQCSQKTIVMLSAHSKCK